MKTTGMLPDALAASISRRSRSDMGITTPVLVRRPDPTAGGRGDRPEEGPTGTPPQASGLGGTTHQGHTAPSRQPSRNGSRPNESESHATGRGRSGDAGGRVPLLRARGPRLRGPAEVSPLLVPDRARAHPTLSLARRGAVTLRLTG